MLQHKKCSNSDSNLIRKEDIAIDLEYIVSLKKHATFKGGINLTKGFKTFKDIEIKKFSLCFLQFVIEFVTGLRINLIKQLGMLI